VLVDADLDLVDILLVEDSPTDVMMTQEALAYYKVLNPLRVVDDGVAAMDPSGSESAEKERPGSA
jgi:hypothetical protein